MVIMNELEWPMLSYYVISYEKFKKVMQWTENAALSLLHTCATMEGISTKTEDNIYIISVYHSTESNLFQENCSSNNN